MTTAATTAARPGGLSEGTARGPLPEAQHTIDSAAWNVFANHQPYYHVLSDPLMLNPGQSARDVFWATGTRDVNALMDFAGLPPTGGTRVDFGCGLGRLTRGLIPFTDRQVGLDISPVMLAKAQELSSFPAWTFRPISPEGWPLDSAIRRSSSASWSSTISPRSNSWSSRCRESARVLRPGGFAVFEIQTMTGRGAITDVASPVRASQADKSSAERRANQTQARRSTSVANNRCSLSTDIRRRHVPHGIPKAQVHIHASAAADAAHVAPQHSPHDTRESIRSFNRVAVQKA